MAPTDNSGNPNPEPSPMNAGPEIGKELTRLLTDAFRDSGRQFRADTAQVAAYTAERVEHLKRSLGEPGYDRAVRAERDAIALMAAGRAVSQADAFDARMLGIIEGGLRIGVVALT
jgi:hypothetical protein